MARLTSSPVPALKFTLGNLRRHPVSDEFLKAVYPFLISGYLFTVETKTAKASERLPEEGDEREGEHEREHPDNPRCREHPQKMER